jgi:glycine/sarcosine N-methyltransferase
MPAETPAHEHDRASKPIDYDAFVNWDARLARELPFFRARFDDVGVERVIDVGAGSAKHSIEFAKWGMSVDAIDPSEDMLASAEKNITEATADIAAAGGEIRLAAGGFGELEAMGLAGADALICTGNALGHVCGFAGLHAALADFAAVVRPGGVVVIHMLNHSGLLASGTRAIAPKVRDTAEGTTVYLRVVGVVEGGQYFDFDFVTLTRDTQGEWSLTSRRSQHTIITAERLTCELEETGFEGVELLGGHDGHALSDADESVIVVARRKG